MTRRTSVIFLGSFARRTLHPALGLAMLIASPGHAALRGALATVEADRAHFGASLSSAAMSTHMVHTLVSAPDIVREFTGADGLVFAVAWRGHARPDLRQLLGVDFDTLQAQTPGGRRRGRRMPLSTRRPDLVLQSAGHPGAFWGFAYIPTLLPTGFSVDDLR